MPPKRGKGRDATDDKTPPMVLKAQVEYCVSVNAPLRKRMGHLSYVHPKNGFLYVVGGCDLDTLPRAVKKSQLEEALEPMPLAEWWDEITRTWGVEGASLREKTPQSEMEELVPSKIDMNKQEDVDAGVDKKERTLSERETFAQSESIAIHRPLRVPDGFSWPTLAATVVQWCSVQKDDRTPPSPAGLNSDSPCPCEAANEDVDALNDADSAGKTGESDIPATREHPVVFFIGGWKRNHRTSHTVGVDMDKGTLLHIRGGMAVSSLPSTCMTGCMAEDCVYVFGGNTGGGDGGGGGVGCTSSVMRTLDLTSRKWVERTEVEMSTSSPLPRSSHVAGVLLDRYVVIHGGRRLSSIPTGRRPEKGKKIDPKVVLPIEKLNLDFCNDVAVYNLEKKQWVATAINVGPLGPPARYGHAACVLSPNELLFHGGIGVGGKVLSDVWILRLIEKNGTNVSISWVKVVVYETKKLPFPSRCHHSLAAAGRRVFITGGTSPSEDVESVCIIEIDPFEMAVTHSDARRRTVLPRDSRRSFV
ncbi:hypothetical protein MOQ_005553 [Trypanosoma cruzi marinkellei]|uniref:Uncharacterized protein n=1 Tax=Trypanosoma cruzi marinkellei TaxID=85056 RepID=K2M6T2_TRYCR|nr:hypothetical protein MOQ_005553 [Trypanosoma cruzi marinkellei]